ncbi:MAG: stage III sporulation protein AG [Eubacteriales bacterium]
MKEQLDVKKITLKNIGVEKLIIMLVVGVFLLIISKPIMSNDEGELKQQENYASLKEIDEQKEEESYEETMEQKLETILKKIDGVGEVDVMITVKSSKELVLNKDRPYSSSETEEKDSEGGERVSSEKDFEEGTVLTNSPEGSNIPFVIKELEPEVSGIVIIAQGGENPTIKNNLIDATEALFNIPKHRIKVMKMVLD